MDARHPSRAVPRPVGACWSLRTADCRPCVLIQTEPTSPPAILGRIYRYYKHLRWERFPLPVSRWITADERTHRDGVLRPRFPNVAADERTHRDGGYGKVDAPAPNEA